MSQVITPSTVQDPRPDFSGGEPLYEVIDGQYVELPPMGVREGIIANDLSQRLAIHANAHDLGRSVVEIMFKLFPDRDQKRRPDVAFLSFERWPKDRPIPDTAAWEVVPDLVVEIVSPTDLAIDVIDRVEDFLRAGSKQVWVVFRGAGVVHVHESPTSVAVKRLGDDLDGADILPGFRIGLAELLRVAGHGGAPTGGAGA